MAVDRKISSSEPFQSIYLEKAPGCQNCQGFRVTKSNGRRSQCSHGYHKMIIHNSIILHNHPRAPKAVKWDPAGLSMDNRIIHDLQMSFSVVHLVMFDLIPSDLWSKHLGSESTTGTKPPMSSVCLWLAPSRGRKLWDPNREFGL